MRQLQSLLQICNQIVSIFNAHRQPQQVGGHGRARAFDAGSVFNQAFGAAQGCGALPQRDLCGFGGMLSIRAAGGEAAAIATAARVALWKRATSLGGTESLIEHRASVEGAGSPVPTDLLRLSVGIEDADDLIADLEQALQLAHQ